MRAKQGHIELVWASVASKSPKQDIFMTLPKDGDVNSRNVCEGLTTVAQAHTRSLAKLRICMRAQAMCRATCRRHHAGCAEELRQVLCSTKLTCSRTAGSYPKVCRSLTKVQTAHVAHLQWCVTPRKREVFPWRLEDVCFLLTIRTLSQTSYLNCATT